MNNNTNDSTEGEGVGYPTEAQVPFEQEEKVESYKLIPGVTNERLDFIRKVYGILSVQLALTFGGVVLFAYQTDARTWLLTVPNTVALPCMVAAITIELMLVCCCRHLSK